MPITIPDVSYGGDNPDPVEWAQTHIKPAIVALDARTALHAQYAPPSFVAPSISSWSPGFSSANLSTGTYLSGYAFANPYIPGQDYTADTVALKVTTAASGSTVRIGLCAPTSTGRPGAVLVDWGTVSGAATGEVQLTLPSPFNFVAGQLYWILTEPSGGTPGMQTYDTSLYNRQYTDTSDIFSTPGNRVTCLWSRTAGAFTGTFTLTTFYALSVAVAFRRSA